MNDWHTQVGLVLIALVILVIRYIPVQSKGPKPLAKRNQGQVNCSVAANHAPKYRHSLALHIRAQELVDVLARDKKVIATHAEGVNSPKLRATIAGVVRARKELKQLEYDQPF